MGPNRTENRIDRPLAGRQRGVTAIGFLILAAVFGIVGFAGLKIAPLYMQKMRLDTVLSDIEQELAGGGANVQTIRNELASRFYIEGLQIPRENIKVNQVRNGYQIQISYQNETPFLADLWFVLKIDEQVEISR